MKWRCRASRSCHRGPPRRVLTLSHTTDQNSPTRIQGENRSTWKRSGYHQLHRQIQPIGSQAANHGVLPGTASLFRQQEGTMIFRAILPAMTAFTFNTGLLQAQTIRGAMQGTVNDSSGSAGP